jgi:anti-anti-sigma factor
MLHQPVRSRRMSTVIERSTPRGFRLFGSIDASNAGSLADVLEECLAEPGDITLELRELEFLDSVGIGVLATAAKRLGEQGNLILEHPVHTVARAVELAGLATLPNLQIVEAAGLPEDITAIEEPPS